MADPERLVLPDHRRNEPFHQPASGRLSSDRQRTASTRASNCHWLGEAAFATTLVILVITWVLLNLGLTALGVRAPDPPPFQWLGNVASLLSLFVVVVVVVVLATQQRDEELTQLNQQLTLQLAILGEQKAAKMIDLIEELRKDHPNIPDRIDHQAEAMAQPANPETVLDAIKAATKTEN
jgi:uncharacterized membrane protein